MLVRTSFLNLISLCTHKDTANGPCLKHFIATALFCVNITRYNNNYNNITTVVRALEMVISVGGMGAAKGFVPSKIYCRKFGNVSAEILLTRLPNSHQGLR